MSLILKRIQGDGVKCVCIYICVCRGRDGDGDGGVYLKISFLFSVFSFSDLKL